MSQRPPKPDALLTIREQLQALHDEWGRAIGTNAGDFGEGQDDVWRQAQKQVKALIDSITLARKRGIYLTDASREMAELIERRHRETLDFLSLLSRRITKSLLPLQPPEEPADGEEADTPL